MQSSAASGTDIGELQFPYWRANLKVIPLSNLLCSLGFSLHAALRWGADQRKELERLCRYITRPAIANERLKRTVTRSVLYLIAPRNPACIPSRGPRYCLCGGFMIFSPTNHRRLQLFPRLT